MEKKKEKKTWWSLRITHKPQPELRLRLSRLRPTIIAQALVLEGQGQKKPSLASSFQAKPSQHITIHGTGTCVGCQKTPRGYLWQSLLTKDHQYHARTKHINIRFHFIRWMIKNRSLHLIYCPMEDMVADSLTKALPSPKVKHFAAELELMSVWGSVGIANIHQEKISYLYRLHRPI